MIEIIQQTDKSTEGKLPKNIRQIGNPEKDFRIYMEDYVYTYLHPTQIYTMGDCQGGLSYEAGELLPRMLILVGEINHFSNRSCAFICGAIQVENSAFAEGLPELNDDTWRRIHKDLKQFFGKSEVVGWVLDIPGNELLVTKEMEEAHRDNFVSPYQFFFLMDSKEREEAFYMWKSGHLTRKEGYFIYYEKNPGMQEYMISKREAACGQEMPTEEIEDRAAKHYRAMMHEKKEQTCQRGTGILSYLSSLLMVILLCAVSVMLLGNIRRMEHMEQTISVMSLAIESTEQEEEGEKNQVSVETISGNVYPLEEAAGETRLREEAAAALTQLEGQEAAPGAQPAEEQAPPSQGEASAGGDQGASPQAGAAAAVSPNPPVQEEAPADGNQVPPSQGEPSASGDQSTSSQGEVPADGNQSPPSQGEAPAGGDQNAPAQGDMPAAGQTEQDEVQKYRSQGYYIVQKGDSLRGICYKIYQTYSMIGPLCEANAIEDQDYIYAGQRIILP